MKHLNIFTGLSLIGTFSLFTLSQCSSPRPAESKPRILISTDIGGTDPDDFQSAIHLFMYANLFQIEGLISSPFGDGRKQDLMDMIELYEKDLSQLHKHADGFPDPDYLRSICKQGDKPAAPFKGYSNATEGSEWIIQCAKKESDQPLWVLVWGGIEDLAQALHDAPEIEENIRVYWIGGPNKKWSVNAYSYIAEFHPNLWMIEANATYRGWFLDAESPKDLTNEAYYTKYIQEAGAMGKAFKKYYKGIIKMGDTPSLAYVMNGYPEDPFSESWGGNFAQIDRSARYLFDRNTTSSDTVVAYGVLEWRFMGPDLEIPEDSACFTMEISNQIWPGYYLGEGIYGVRYSSKKPETCTYLTSSDIPELDGQTGQFVSIAPWPGEAGPDDYSLGAHWYSDRPEAELFFGIQQGARTVSKHREAFLSDWAQRWEWIKNESDLKDLETRTLRFSQGEAGSYTFNTGELMGVFRQEGASTGLVPLIYTPDSISFSAGEGLFNHYRVFTRGKRYGYGARRWPSSAELQSDGSVEVSWPSTADRPFELFATYRWVASNTLDLVTTVRASARLEDFEVFLASYYSPGFTDSRVWASEDPRGGGEIGFVSADRELGEWLTFPRDKQAEKLISDGRWDLGSSPIEWTMMPAYDRPLAIRRNSSSGLTVIVMAQEEDCFGIYTPYGEEKHYSNYLSLFGYDIEPGKTVRAITRLVVLNNPSETEILDVFDTFVKTND